LHNLSLYLARIHATTRKSTLALRQRKRFLVSQLMIFPDSLRASLVEWFSRCGNANCACHHDGDKHGPFYYLPVCNLHNTNRFRCQSVQM